MGFVDDLIAKGGGLFDPIPEPTQTDAVKSDRFDHLLWEDTKTKAPGLKEAIRESGKTHDYVDDFYQDTFNLAHKGDPIVRESGEMVPTHSPHATLMSEFADSKQMTELRQYTQGDQYSSAMATLAMQPAIEQAYERMEQAREFAQAVADAAAARAEAAQAALDAAGAADAAPEDPAAAAAAQAAAQAAYDALSAEQQAALDAAAANAAAAHAAGNALDQAAREASDQAADEESTMHGFGVDDGTLQRMDFAERHALAKRLRSNRLAKFAKLLGQFRTMAAAESRRKVKHAPDEVSGVKLGNDLNRLLPQELINMATPETEDDFWMRYVDSSLWTWELSGTEKLGRGPIIAVVDESGSMGANDMGGGATREAWSKAFALALYDQARREKRDFHYVGFSSGQQVWHQQFPATGSAVAALPAVINMTEHFWGGGTNYEAPLTKAVSIVEEYALRDLPKPDIVFITDDDYGSLDGEFMSRWQNAKDKHQMRCYGVGLHITSPRGALATVSDNVRLLAELSSNPLEVADIFRTL